jgi:hypothetical protein
MAKRPSRATQTTIALPESEVDLVRFEKNLLQIGFFSAHDRRSSKDDTLRRVEQWVNRNGKQVKVAAEFRCALGLPSTADRDKYMAFMKIAMEKKLKFGQLTNPIRFSGYSMLNALGIADSGANYEDLNTWGKRMADTTITSEEIIYSSTRQKFLDKTVHLFRSFERSGERDHDGGNQSVQYEVVLEDWVLDNINQQYVIPEDFALYRKLVRPISKALFVHLPLWFYANKCKKFEKDYSDICSLLNIRNYPYLSKIKETMGLALEDLVKIGYLEKWDIQVMKSKAGFKVVLFPGAQIIKILSNNNSRLLPPSTENELTKEQDSVRRALIERNVSEEKALTICTDYDVRLVQDQLDYLDAELLRTRGRILNPAGFILSFIEAKKAVPPTFETSSQKAARKKAQAEDEAKKNAEAAAKHLEWQYQQRYAAWVDAKAEEVIASQLTAEEVEHRLILIRREFSKDKRIGAGLDKMPAKSRRDSLMMQLKKEVAAEINLCSYDEWKEANSQGELFV